MSAEDEPLIPGVFLFFLAIMLCANYLVLLLSIEKLLNGTKS